MRNLIIGALLLSAAAAPALAQSVAPATGPRFMSVSDASALSSNLVGLSVTNAGGQTRIYQRLIADDADEAIEIASAEIEESSIIAFYDTVGIDILRLASQEHLTNARPEHRLRLADGISTLLEDLRDQYPPSVPDRKESPAVLCIGGKWEVDALAGEMLAHALAVEGIAASSRPAASGNAAYLAKLDLNGAEVVCLSFLTPNPALPARNACRRIRRQWPNLRIVLALWNAPPDLLTDEALEQFKADAIVTSVQEAVRRIHRIVDPDGAMTNQAASLPDDDQKRVHALAATRILDGDKRYMLDALAKRAADVFDARLSVISAIDKDHECQSACKFDPVSASNFDPFARRGLRVALGPSELAGIAETGRARVA